MKKATINIEFAHIDFSLSLGSAESQTYIRRSGEIAREIVSACTEQQDICTTSVLIDDKHCERTPSLLEVHRLLAQVRKYGPSVDFVCFESTLPYYEDRIFQCLAPIARRKVRKD